MESFDLRGLPAALAARSEQLLRDLAELAGGSTVWLAVTGLSRSGKTVFTTSLIHNLLSALHNPNRMPLLNVVADGRLRAVSIAGANGRKLPRFDYAGNIEALTGEVPDWPARTADVSEIAIEIRFAPANPLGKVLSEITGSPARVTLRVVDYPGEWLLDLPLLDQTYAEWAHATVATLRSGVRAEIDGEFLQFLAAHPPHERADEAVARQAHALYRAYLLKARDQFALTFLQPGRFLNPGTLGEAPYLVFAPLDVAAEPELAAPGTLAALMAERFDRYKREVVQRFYGDHFRHYARQIVLVDVLRALLAGRDAFNDMRLALDTILGSFRYGHGGILAKLLFGSHIDKVLFAATKADHIPDIQRDHLAQLLRNMAAFPALEVMHGNAQLDVMAIAAVVSTAEDSQEIDGQVVQVVVGRPVGAHKRSKFFVGTVPIRPPRPEAWGKPFLNVPVFEPPLIDASPVDGIPHINLDLALEFLLGDRLR